MKYATFFLIVSVVVDIYLYRALRSTNISWAQTRRFKVLWWTYSIVVLGGVILSTVFNLQLIVRSIFLVAFFISFVTKFAYMLVFLIDDIRRGGVWLKRRFFSKKEVKEEAQSNAISRSDFLAKSGIVLASIPFAGLSWGIIGGAYDYKIIKQKLYLPNLPAAFHGLQIVQISDIHSGSFYNKRAVMGGIEMVLGLRPDVIFFTGDIVNNLTSEIADYKDMFSRLKAPLGVYSILGNHDYGDYHYGPEPSKEKAENLRQLIQAEKEMGWDLLLNENRRLRVDNEEIGILGVENWGKGRFIRRGDLKKTLEGSEDLPVKLLLSHDPSHWRAQVLDHADIDVTFSGHTHGMQFGVRLPNYQWSPAQYIYPEWAGMYTHENQQLYVNVGYGFLGYPGRLGIRPEITQFELIRGTDPRIIS